MTVPYTIDEQSYQPFDAQNTVFGRRLWDEEAIFYGTDMHARALDLIAEDEPGYSHLEYARIHAAWTVSDRFQDAYAWQQIGERDGVIERLGRHPVSDRGQMAREVKETARIFGASLVGITRLDRRWIYTHTRNGRPVTVPEGMEYAIVMAIAMDQPMIETSPAYPAATATGVGYSRMAFAIACLSQFIRNLGYQAIPMGNDTALSIPLAIDAGLGELGRNGLLITPQYGPCVRLCKVFTDLPLLPDQPAPFGVMETCRACRKCAEACKVEAIQDTAEPSFDVVTISNNRGIRRWAVNHDKCYAYWVENGACCSTCISVCPYMKRAQK